MKKLSKHEMLLLVITLGLMLLFGGYQFFIKPMHEGGLNIDDQLQMSDRQLNKAKQLLSERQEVEQRYQNLVDLIGDTDSDEAQMPTIVSKIDAAARQSNIHIANIQPQKTLAQKDVRYLSVELEIDGQWLDIVQFLFLLQQRPNFYFINELNLEKYSGAINSLRGRIVISRLCLVNPS